MAATGLEEAARVPPHVPTATANRNNGGRDEPGDNNVHSPAVTDGADCDTPYRGSLHNSADPQQWDLAGSQIP